MKFLTLASAVAALSVSTVQAASVCNCCSGAQAAASCPAVCAAATMPEGQCIAMPDFSAEAVIGEGVNPLYDVPLQSLSLGTPSRAERESFRQFLEAARRGAERDRKLALKAEASAKISAAEAANLAKRYEMAIVNYYLGMKAYRASSK